VEVVHGILHHYSPNGSQPQWTTPLMDHEGLTDQRGAEVIGLDFALPGDRETRDTLNRSFMDHHIGPPHWTTTC